MTNVGALRGWGLWVCVGALCGASAVGCSGGDDGRNDAGNGGNAGNAGAAGVGPTGGTGGMQAGGSGGLGSGGTSGGGGNDPLDENNACGVGTAEAELTPVNMLIMFDRSGSMEDDDKWPNATAALTAFLQHPDAEGLKVALRFFPHDEPAEGCTEDGCDAAACEQPLVNIDTLLAESAPTDAHEERLVDAIEGAEPGGGNGGSGGTPIYAALDGALRWATSHKATTPDETTVVIFLTDGEPNGCDEDFDNISMLASDALASSGVPTYAIGLEGSSEDQMDQLAMAGGTNSGIFIGNSANAETELLAALNAIRGETLSCDFPMPEPMDTSMVIDPTRVNVTFTNGAGVAGTLRQVADAGACANGSAWYYDDMDAPTRIHLCPASCDTVRADPAGRLEILIGCSTCGGVDVDCGDGQVPPGGLPPVIPD